LYCLANAHRFYNAAKLLLQTNFLAAIQFVDVAENGDLVLDSECIIQDSAAAFSHRIYPTPTANPERFTLHPKQGMGIVYKCLANCVSDA